MSAFGLLLCVLGGISFLSDYGPGVLFSLVCFVAGAVIIYAAP